LETKRREPWLFGEPWTNLFKDAIQRRYQILPYFYTLFYEASVSGIPVMRPLVLEYPTDPETFSMDNQYLLGKDILVKPVTQKGAQEVDIYFPGNEFWYDYDTLSKITTLGKTRVKSPLEKILSYQRGGSIIPLKLRNRRSSTQMNNDPLTLQIALNSKLSAIGTIYIDDGYTFNYQKGEKFETEMSVENQAQSLIVIQNKRTNGEGTSPIQVERVILAGLPSSPKEVTIENRLITFTFENNILIIRKPQLGIASNWKIKIKF